MATLYIAEFANVGMGNQPMALGAPVAEQTLTIGSTSVLSAAFNGATNFVRLHNDAICSVAFGTAPTATAAKMRMAANTTEYFGVPPSGLFKVAVITNT